MKTAMSLMVVGMALAALAADVQPAATAGAAATTTKPAAAEGARAADLQARRAEREKRRAELKERMERRRKAMNGQGQEAGVVAENPETAVSRRSRGQNGDTAAELSRLSEEIRLLREELSNLRHFLDHKGMK